MREFLFHGKRIDNGKWVEGYLFIANWYLNDEKFTAIMRTDTTAFPHCEVSGWEEVDPETVGQYTELTDKNEKKIFEGDIVEIDGKRYEVKYMLGQFFVGINMPIAYKRFDCEVIGNIHDNPELLQMEE